MFCSSSVSLQIVGRGEEEGGRGEEEGGRGREVVLMQGSVGREKIVENGANGKVVRAVLNSVDGFDKVVVSLGIS